MAYWFSRVRALPVLHAALRKPWHLPPPFRHVVRGHKPLPDSVVSVPCTDARRIAGKSLDALVFPIAWGLLSLYRHLANGDTFWAFATVVTFAGFAVLGMARHRFTMHRRERDEPVYGLTIWPEVHSHDDVAVPAPVRRPALLIAALDPAQLLVVPRTAIQGYRFAPTADGNASAFVATTMEDGRPAELWLGDLAIGVPQLDAHLQSWLGATTTACAS